MELNIWVEKYRPKLLDDMILDIDIKEKFQYYIDNGIQNNLLFSGPPGIGKTTIAKILLNLLKKKINIMWLNGSDSRGINIIREQIAGFISTKTFMDRKVVCIDEGEALTTEAFGALKGLIEEYYTNASFILTTNFLYKVPEAIRSRFIIYEFKKPNKNDTIELYKKILNSENVKYKDENLEMLYNMSGGDLRKSIHYMQDNSRKGEFILNFKVYNEIVNFYKEKDIKGLKKYIAENNISDYEYLYRYFYDRINSFEGIIVIGKYLYQHSFVVDPEINFVCMIIDLINLKKSKK